MPSPPSPPRARIVHLLHGLRAGGMERVVLDLCRAARDRGHDDRIVLFDTDHVDPARDLDPGDVPIVYAPRRRGLDAAGVLRIGRALRAARPRVLHAHNDTAAVYGALAVRLLPRGDRPGRLVTFHNAPTHATARARWVTRRACRGARAVVTVTHELSERLGRERWFDGAVVVPNGVDVDRFRPPDRPPATGPLRVGMVARLVPGKRHDLLLAAIDRLVSRQIDVRLTLAGDGPARDRVDRALTTIAGARRIAHVSDMAAFLHELDVAVLLSDHEGAPMALLEALACGRAVIASAVGGIPELVGHDSALLVANTVDDVASALCRATDPAFRRSLGARARQQVVERHALRLTVDQYESLLAK